MKRTLVAMMVAGTALVGLAKDAQAQVLITPTGPLAIRPRVEKELSPILDFSSDLNKVYPGRTMGGGPRILRSSPPPSSLNRQRD